MTYNCLFDGKSPERRWRFSAEYDLRWSSSWRPMCGLRGRCGNPDRWAWYAANPARLERAIEGGEFASLPKTGHRFSAFCLGTLAYAASFSTSTSRGFLTFSISAANIGIAYSP
jgi:hypothetical protein